MRDAIIEVEKMFEEVLERKNLCLVLEGNLDIFISAERISLVNEVFNNIISNAIKFSPEGGKITIHAEASYNTAKVSILDEGAGLSAAQIATFEAGDILDSTIGTSGEKGTGFGLSLVRGYMNVYGGPISLTHENARISGAGIILTFNRV